MKLEEMQWIGDGLHVPETDELVGNPVNYHGRKGVVVSNTAFTITVKWESWFQKLWRKLTDRGESNDS